MPKRLPEMRRRQLVAEALAEGNIALPVRCDDCGKVVMAADVGQRPSRKVEFFMLRADVWREVMPGGSGNLCVLCVERRLGRQLTSADFANDQDAYLQLLAPSSALLARRRATPDTDGVLHKREVRIGGQR